MRIKGNSFYQLLIQILSIRKALIDMTSSINIRDFLHDVLANRARAKLTIEQFGSLLNMANQIQKFSQKGLLIITLAEQLHKMSNVNYVSIKKFMNEFLTGLKPQKPRKEREGGQPRRRRNRLADSTNVARNLQQMAQESLSNPSNLQQVRAGLDATHSQQSDSNKVSQNMSKKSDPNKKDFQFANQLNQISEGLQLITGQQFQYQQQQQIEQYSKASSSSQSFGVVSNLSEKMDLLKRNQDKDVQKKTKTIKRPSAQATMTKKKGAKANIVDQMLTLQKTRATLNDSVLFEQRSISYEYFPWIDQYHHQNDIFQMTHQEYIQAIKENPLSTFDNIILSARKNGQRRNMFQNIHTDFTQFDTGGYQGETMHDFTSQPMPQFQENFDGSQVHINQLSIFDYENSHPTLAEISLKVNKPPALVFYEMLAKMQKGQILMEQEDPKQFGQIRIQLLMSNQ